MNSRLGLCSVVIVDSYEEIVCDGGDGMKERVSVQSLCSGDGDTKTRKEEKLTELEQLLTSSILMLNGIIGQESRM